MPRLQSITLQPKDRDYKDRNGEFIRVPAERAVMLADHGIQGDRKAGRAGTRQVNLLTTDWLARMQADGYRTGPGQFGEQLILDGPSFGDIRPGDRIRIGSEAVLEITVPRQGCDRLEAAQGKTIDPEIKAAIGFLARVVEGGEIRVGDPVTHTPVEESVHA